MLKKLFEKEFLYPDASFFSNSDAGAGEQVRLDTEDPRVKARPVDLKSAEDWARRLSPELVNLGASSENLRTYSQSTPEYRKLEFD